MAAPAAAAAASTAMLPVPNPAEFKFYDTDPSSSDDTDSDPDADDGVDARTFLFSAIGVAYTNWYNEAVPDTRNCQECQTRGRVCLEYYDRSTQSWYCFWRVVTLGMKAVKATPVSAKAQKKRKAASPGSPLKGESAAAAAVVSSAGRRTPEPAELSAESPAKKRAIGETPAKTRKFGETNVLTEAEFTHVAPSRARRQEVEGALSMVAADVVGLINAYSDPYMLCASGHCAGGSRVEDVVCDPCQLCYPARWNIYLGEWIKGYGKFCRSCARVHQNTMRHEYNVQLDALNQQMNTDYGSLELAQAEYAARQLEMEKNYRLRQDERRKQRRKERRVEQKAAAAAAAAAAEVQAEQDALDESETAQPDPDADAPIA
jgi:hypothetical protein